MMREGRQFLPDLDTALEAETRQKRLGPCRVDTIGDTLFCHMLRHRAGR